MFDTRPYYMKIQELRILIEDVRLCSNTHNKTVYTVSNTTVYDIGIYCNMFRHFFRPSSGQRTQVKGATSAYYVLRDPTVCSWRDSPQRATASSFTRFLDHTQRCTTVGRTPLHERSARRRDLYLTTQHSQHTFMPPVGFEPTISAGQRPQIYALGLARTGGFSPQR